MSFRSDRSRSWCGTSPSKDTRTSEGGWATSCSNSFQLTWLPVAIRPARFYGHFSPSDKIKEIARKCLLCVEPKRVARRVLHAPLRRTVRKLLSTCLRTCLVSRFCISPTNSALGRVSFDLCRVTMPVSRTQHVAKCESRVCTLLF